jgi:hypothetical protein
MFINGNCQIKVKAFLSIAGNVSGSLITSIGTGLTNPRKAKVLGFCVYQTSSGAGHQIGVTFTLAGIISMYQFYTVAASVETRVVLFGNGDGLQSGNIVAAAAPGSIGKMPYPCPMAWYSVDLASTMEMNMNIAFISGVTGTVYVFYVEDDE